MRELGWNLTLEVEEFATAATAFLEEEPCSRNVLRWVVELARQGSPSWSAAPSFWWLGDAASASGAAIWTPPFNLHVSELPPDSAPALAVQVRARSELTGHPVAGVTGPRDAAAALAREWEEAGGARGRLGMAETLYELTRVHPVARPDGERRAAREGELGLLVRWLRAFSEEAGLPMGVDPRSLVRSMLSDGLIDVWTDGDHVVSMAGHRPPVAGVVRVGPVYTPPARRGRGYARRLVAEVSAAALELPDVHHCMLYADRANPVSNSIYMQIGYTAREEHRDYRFQ